MLIQRTVHRPVFLAVFLIIAILQGKTAYAVEATEGPPSYAGFSRIDSGKTFFVVVGDTRGKSAWEFWREKTDGKGQAITDEIARRNPAFVINLGDLVMAGSSASDWRGFDNMNNILREKGVPYLPILGNHELRGDRKEALANYFARFHWLDDRRWYSFTWKNVGFIMLDSNFGALDDSQRKEQEDWYLSELMRFESDRSVEYVIVCCHEPPFTNGEVEAPNPKSEALFARPFLRFAKTRLFFSGHSHTYERFEKKGKFFIVSGGGGAPRHKVDTAGTFQDSFSGPPLRFFHFCQIEDKDGVLIFRVIRLDEDGSFSVADSVTLRANSD